MAKMDRKKVLVTYGWNRIAYIILRSLAIKGIDVFVGDSSRLAMSRMSKYCKGFIRYPSFYEDPKGFVTSIIDFCRKNKIGIYFPVHEETFIAAKFIDLFKESDIIVPVVDFDKLVKVHRKDSVIKYAESLGIPVPKTFVPKDFYEAKELLEICRYPLVIKQINTNSAKGVFYAHSKEGALKILEKIEKNERDGNRKVPPILQEYVTGSGYGVSLLFNRGKLRAIFTHKRLREKTFTGGTSTLRVGTINPIIEEYAINLLESLQWHGVAMVEFKFNEARKKAWLIEVNPRFWGSLALPVASGVDFPYLLYKIAAEGDVQPLSRYETGIRARWILGDILAVIDEIKNTCNPFKAFLNFFRFNNDIYDDLWKDDLYPFVFEFFYYAGKFIRTGSTNPVKSALLEVDKL